jgi:hypothetical protein
MVATLLRLVGFNLKRLARETAITIVLAMLGVFAAMVALACGLSALYFWLEFKLGTFAALGIVGGMAALLAIVLFAIVFLRARRKPRARAEDAVRAAADSVEASAAAGRRRGRERSSRHCAQRLAPADRHYDRLGSAHRLGARAPSLGPPEETGAGAGALCTVRYRQRRRPPLPARATSGATELCVSSIIAASSILHLVSDPNFRQPFRQVYRYRR